MFEFRVNFINCFYSTYVITIYIGLLLFKKYLSTKNFTHCKELYFKIMIYN